MRLFRVVGNKEAFLPWLCVLMGFQVRLHIKPYENPAAPYRLGGEEVHYERKVIILRGT